MTPATLPVATREQPFPHLWEHPTATRDHSPSQREPWPPPATGERPASPPRAPRAPGPRPDGLLAPPQGGPARALRRLAAGRGEQRPLRGAAVAGRGPHTLPSAVEALFAEEPGRGRLAHLQGGTPAHPGWEGRPGAPPGPRPTPSVPFPRPGPSPAAGGRSAAAQATRRSPKVRSAPAGKPTSGARCTALSASRWCTTTPRTPPTRTKCTSSAPSRRAGVSGGEAAARAAGGQGGGTACTWCWVRAAVLETGLERLVPGCWGS